MMIASYRKKSQHLLIGLMSGTSLDGVDAALVHLATDEKGFIHNVELQEFICLPYTEALKQTLLSISLLESAKLDQIVIANVGVSEWYAKAVEELLCKAGIDASDVDAICSHGQTIWHAPNPAPFPGPDENVSVRASLQIGDISVLAERTGITVVGNFRARDMAAGGEGAPLVPFADHQLFKSVDKGRIVQNIGGIGNATVLPAGSGLEDVLAFDTGPGGMVVDAIVRRETNGAQSFDKDGRIAAEGTVCEPLLGEYLDHPYFKRRPPKSTGREMFDKAYVQQLIAQGKKRGLAFADIVATATALTATSIVNAYNDFVFPHTPIDEVIIGGGGAKNKTLLNMIASKLPANITVNTSTVYGIPADAKEAISFAILGHETLMGRPSNVPSVTGANRPVIQGTVCL